MVEVARFRGSVVHPTRAAEVIAPPTDALGPAERRAHRAAHPLSFLHVTRSPSEEPDEDPVDDRTTAHRALEALHRLLDAESFSPIGDPVYLVYEIEVDGRTQRGLVCELTTTALARHGRPHEAVDPDRVTMLATHYAVVGAASSPMACTVLDGGPLSEALGSTEEYLVEHEEYLVEHEDADGVIHRVLRVPDAEPHPVERALAGQELYIIDGHHRAAAMAQLLSDGIDRPALVAIFPSGELEVGAFHRLIRLPEALSSDRFLDRLRYRFRNSAIAGPERPSPGSLVVGRGDRWLRLELDERPVAGGPLICIGSMDPVVAEREVVLGAAEGFTSRPDVVHVPDRVPLDELVARASDEGRVCLLVPPVELADVLEVAGHRHVLPPKTTHFWPKLLSGVLLRRFDG